ncbi:MAG: Bug family tripartite tricarboxylate transporter substrate binding protein [Cupriavidus necator]
MPEMRIHRKLVGLFASFCLLVPAWSAAQDKPWPEKPIRMLVPFPPGGGADIGARYIAASLEKKLGQPVVVENVPGMGGSISLQKLARSPADGYTIGFAHIGTLAINPIVYPNVGYDPVKAFAPIAQLSEYENVLVVSSKSPYHSVSDLIEAAKKKQGTMTFGSAGNGTSNHVCAALLASMSGVKLNHIPYKGSAAALLGVMAGDIDFMFDTPMTSGDLIRAGKLRALAATGKKRSAMYMNLPTVDETVPKYEFIGWSGIVAPAGTPPRIVSRLSEALERISSSPETQERYRQQGVVPFFRGPKDFSDLIRRDLDKWGDVIKAANVRVD